MDNEKLQKAIWDTLSERQKNYSGIKGMDNPPYKNLDVGWCFRWLVNQGFRVTSYLNDNHIYYVEAQNTYTGRVLKQAGSYNLLTVFLLQVRKIQTKIKK